MAHCEHSYVVGSFDDYYYIKAKLRGLKRVKLDRAGNNNKFTAGNYGKLRER